LIVTFSIPVFKASIFVFLLPCIVPGVHNKASGDCGSWCVTVWAACFHMR
jgi:hypothetical protein